MKPLHELSASEIVQAIETGRTSAEAVARACLERIAEREREVQAWQFLDPELVVAQARALDRGAARGALHGVPVGFKDIIDTADVPTENGSPIYEGHRPAADAACVALTRRAGGIVMGKTVTTEFANVYPGKTRNPFDPQRTPGGSSSGSGAAVGDFMVPLAVGTQTTGSTMRPAAFCGCVGYRPTWGDLRMTGVKEAAGSLDTLGLIARSVEDIALFRDVLLGVKPEPLPEDSGQPWHIGFCRTPVWEKCEPATQRGLEALAGSLARSGAKVSEVTLPPDYARIADAHLAISSFEFSRNFAWEIDHHWERISEKLRNGRIAHGLGCDFERYIEARTFAERCRTQFDVVMAEHDLLLVPAVLGEPPVGLASTGSAAPCTIWTTLHVPALTVPLLRGPNGLPIGAQFVTRRNEDRRLMSACRWVLAKAR